MNLLILVYDSYTFQLNSIFLEKKIIWVQFKYRGGKKSSDPQHIKISAKRNLIYTYLKSYLKNNRYQNIKHNIYAIYLG